MTPSNIHDSCPVISTASTFFFFFLTDARLCADPQTEPETEATGKVQNRWHSYRKDGNSSAKLLLIQQTQIYVPQVCGSVLRAVLVTQT